MVLSVMKEAVKELAVMAEAVVLPPEMAASAPAGARAAEASKAAAPLRDSEEELQQERREAPVGWVIPC